MRHTEQEVCRVDTFSLSVSLSFLTAKCLMNTVKSCYWEVRVETWKNDYRNTGKLFLLLSHVRPLSMLLKNFFT